MARIVIQNAYVTFASNDISSYITSVSLSTTFDTVDTTGLGSVSRTRVAGLGDNQVTFEFNQDFAAGAIEALVYPTLGTAVAVTIRPQGTGTTPVYSFNALVSEWQPLSGAVGELATASVSWPISGAITKA
jgi:hypothetical protein